jgi:hypothetical protein
MNDLDWKKPALIGGLIAGVLSAIPGISILNACCCGWSIVGGVIAAKMVIGQSARPVKSGEGAQIGLMAGLVCALSFVLVSFPIVLSGVAVDLSMSMLDMVASRSGDPRLLEMIQTAREQAANQTAVQRLVTTLPVLLVQAVIFGGVCVLGGLLGVALFEKRKDEPPPPPAYPSSSGAYGGGNWPPSGN